MSTALPYKERPETRISPLCLPQSQGRVWPKEVMWSIPLPPYENGTTVESYNGKIRSFKVKLSRFKSYLQLPGHQTSDHMVKLSASAPHLQSEEENPVVSAICFICSPSPSSSDNDSPSFGNCYLSHVVLKKASCHSIPICLATRVGMSPDKPIGGFFYNDF